jgi:hypothetical protein
MGEFSPNLPINIILHHIWPQLLEVETWVHNRPALDVFWFHSLQWICPFVSKNKTRKTRVHNRDVQTAKMEEFRN